MATIYVIHVAYSFFPGTFGASQNGFLREYGDIIGYKSRRDAEHHADSENSGIYHLRNGEGARPVYSVREAHPNMRIVIHVNWDRRTETAVEAVNNWDGESVYDLRDALRRLDSVCEARNEQEGRGFGLKADQLVNMTSLLSDDFPDDIDTECVWALDRHGMVLCGETADEIRSLDDLR